MGYKTVNKIGWKGIVELIPRFDMLTIECLEALNKQVFKKGLTLSENHKVVESMRHGDTFRKHDVYSVESNERFNDYIISENILKKLTIGYMADDIPVIIIDYDTTNIEELHG